MNGRARAEHWKFIQEGFAEDKVPLGTRFPIAMMIEVRREDAIASVRDELTRRGFEIASVEKGWWPFGRRWSVAVKSQGPRPIDEMQIETLLDSLDGALAQHDATVRLWVPLRPAPN